MYKGKAGNAARVWAGLSCGIFAAALALFLMLPMVFRFLSEDRPVKSRILVVQGWLFPFMFDEVAERVVCDSVSLIMVTGSRRTVEYGRNQLIRNGVCPEKVEIVPFDENFKGIHTFREAYSLRDYLNSRQLDIAALNIITSAAHGKKTLVTFKKVLGKNIDVGVITCKRNRFDETHLLRSCDGIRVTIKYLIGYIYALLRPANS